MKRYSKYKKKIDWGFIKYFIESKHHRYDKKTLERIAPKYSNIKGKTAWYSGFYGTYVKKLHGDLPF